MVNEYLKKYIKEAMAKQEERFCTLLAGATKKLEESFLKVSSRNLQILTQRLDKIECGLKKTDERVEKAEIDILDIKESLNFQENDFKDKLSKINDTIKDTERKLKDLNEKMRTSEDHSRDQT